MFSLITFSNIFNRIPIESGVTSAKLFSLTLTSFLVWTKEKQLSESTEIRLIMGIRTFVDLMAHRLA